MALPTQLIGASRNRPPINRRQRRKRRKLAKAPRRESRPNLRARRLSAPSYRRLCCVARRFVLAAAGAGNCHCNCQATESAANWRDSLKALQVQRVKKRRNEKEEDLLTCGAAC